MKKGWETTQLSAVATVQSGAGFPNRYQGQPDGVIPFYKVSDMNIAGNEREMVFANNLITEGARRELGAFLFPQGSTIFPKIGGAIATNKKRLTIRDCCVDNNVMGVIPKQGKINCEFLFYFFLAHDLSEFANEAHFPSIKKTVVEAWPISVPPLAEQQRIVSLLDEAFEGIAIAKANAEKNLQNARAIFESHLQSVFTNRGPEWVEKRLDGIAEFSQGIQIGVEDQSNIPAKNLVRFIRIIDYTQGTNEIRYVQDPGRRYWVDKSDIVMVRYGTPGLVGRGIEGVIANNLFKISILDGSLTKDFLAYILSQRSVQNYLSSQGSSTMPALTFTQLGALVISFPHELEKQNLIVSKLDSIRKETQRLAQIYQQKVSALSALKKSLLHQAFTGQL